ncbi:MAG: DNA-3-methyladenine glycosylase 2 family protein, partial [Candidatus Marinimicrobia bacterium]|nr:DNA-3-methyladenine glycosylase 2 family protein [Candidatus Neomarinimicrobiota bacterium]
LFVKFSADLDTAAFTDNLINRFGLKQDLDGFYHQLSDDPLFDIIIKPLKGLRIFQKTSPFESLVAAIVDQQLNLTFAETLKSRLIKNFGKRHIFDDIILYEFPTAETLAQQDDLVLRPFQFTNNKSRYIIRLARDIANGNIVPEDWNNLDDAELLENLISIHGVGPWTAEYSALVGFNRLNMLPTADIGLLNALQKVYQLEERPSAKKVREIARKWEPYRGMVTFYLWYAYEQGLLGNQ